MQTGEEDGHDKNYVNGNIHIRNVLQWDQWSYVELWVQHSVQDYCYQSNVKNIMIDGDVIQATESYHHLYGNNCVQTGGR